MKYLIFKRFQLGHIIEVFRWGGKKKERENKISCSCMSSFPLTHNSFLEEGQFHGKACKGNNLKLLLIHHHLPFPD